MPTIKRMALAAAALILSLELLLQIGALVIAIAHRPQATTSNGREEILCIGDSFTFGVGSTSPDQSYPGHLQTILHDEGMDLHVVNAGYPGQHSGDLLSRVDTQITEATRVVCVLVGTNDAWRHPERITPGSHQVSTATDDGFRLVWRTGRLIDLLLHFEWFNWERAGTDEATPAPSEDGRARTPHDRAAALQTAFRVMADLGLQTGSVRPRFVPDPLAPDAALTRECWDMIGSEHFDQALASAQALETTHADSAHLMHIIAAAAMRGGKREIATDALARLEELAQSADNEAARDILASVRLVAGHLDEAIAAAKQRIAEEPRSFHAWRTLQSASFTAGNDAEALPAMERTLDLNAQSNPPQSGRILRNYVRLIKDEDPDRAASLFVAAYLLDEDIEESRLALRILASTCPRSLVAQKLAELDLAPSDTTRALSDLLTGEDGAEWTETLAAHLTGIHAVARSRGVDMILLTYPFLQPNAEPVQRAVAAELGIPLVEVRKRLDRALETQTRAELFVDDGHCNDAGYRLVAEEVAAALVQVLAR